jgi:uncharacterized protein YjbI with pentapeptide repeats
MNQLHNNEILICDDVFKYVILPYLTIYDLLKIVTTNKQFKKLIQNIIPDHPYNLHNAVWEGPKLNILFRDNPFILPRNPQNYIYVGANLTNANLTNANLTNANLTNANLNGANLSLANLSYVILKNANLENANLKNSDLINANLENANLMYTNLHNISLIDANLTNANLKNANLKNANLLDANLTNVRTYDHDFHKKYPDTILFDFEDDGSGGNDY